MINAAKQEIKRRFGVLINRNMLKVSIKGKILTLTGTIKSVKSMNENVMQKYIPNHCKAISGNEDHVNDNAIYKFRFDARIKEIEK